MAQQELVQQDERTEVATSESAAIMQVIERAAANPDVDMDKMERLLQMQERVHSRNAEMAFNSALASLQSELPEITEKGEIRHNGKLISTYARWEDVNRSIKPSMREHGFALSFRVDTSERVHVEGVLSHQGGHSERTSITLPADTSGSKNPVQAVASSVSYGKRYVAGALLNITSGGEDDDGQAAGTATIDEEQASRLVDLIEATKTDQGKFLKWLYAGKPPADADIRTIPATVYGKAEAKLRQKLKQMEADK